MTLEQTYRCDECGANAEREAGGAFVQLYVPDSGTWYQHFCSWKCLVAYVMAYDAQALEKHR